MVHSHLDVGLLDARVALRRIAQCDDLRVMRGGEFGVSDDWGESLG
jgi:hypothetical protein